MTSPEADDTATTIRADKWLWQARFFKSRSLAAKIVSGGHLRVNGECAPKAATQVQVGDTLTFPQARQVRVVRIAALGVRRGPAAEAQTLYEDLTPEQPRDRSAPRVDQGRPSRDARRAARAAKHGPLE